MGHLLLSVRKFEPHEKPGKPWMAVISRGGHPKIDPDTPCEVLDAAEFESRAECHEWFDRMQIEQPWEKRQ